MTASTQATWFKSAHPEGFTLPEGDSPVVLLSAGIGATPVLSMLYSLVSNTKREVWWCYGARNGREHPFAAEARKLLADLPNSRSFIAYSQPGEGDQQGRNYDAHGHLTLSSLEELHLPKMADFYLCGPPAFLTARRNRQPGRHRHGPHCLNVTEARSAWSPAACNPRIKLGLQRVITRAKSD